MQLVGALGMYKNGSVLVPYLSQNLLLSANICSLVVKNYILNSAFKVISCEALLFF